MRLTPLFETTFDVEFGDCDPAGIVFYPRFFGWLDATFQRWLRTHGLDQAAIRERFGGAGTGLVEASATFRAPVRPGERLSLRIAAVDWAPKVFAVRYVGLVGERRALEGVERRGLFLAGENGVLRLGPLAPLRAVLDPQT